MFSFSSEKTTLLRKIASQLPSDTATFDAQILLEEITGLNLTWFLNHPETGLSVEQNNNLEIAIRKLQAGIPLPYVLGHWGFFGVDFFVNPDVLIPRPETELLVETALAFIQSQSNHNINILDIGTGSGIIPISLAMKSPQATFVAVDISPNALQVGKSNADRYGLTDRITFIEADLIPDELENCLFDLICANLPYIPTETLINLEVYGKEPTVALDGGPDGLDLIRKLIMRISDLTINWKLILLEIEQRQGSAVSAFVHQIFPNANVRVQTDLAGFDRLVVIRP